MSKIILIKVNTGFCGATHEEEIEYTGQSSDEIEQLEQDFRDEVIGQYIEVSSEILDEDEY